MYLETSELHAFAVLAGELHFGRAAERLTLSQPALTRLIQRLEKRVGASLFARSRRKVLLTEAGRALLPEAERLVRGSEHALVRVREVAEGRAGALRVGFGIASVSDVLPRAILRFRQAYPEVELYLRDMSTASQIHALDRGEIDVGIIRISASPPETDGFALFSERLVIAAPRSFTFNARKGLAGLRTAPFVLLPATTSTTFHEHVLAVCRNAGFSPRVVQEAGEMFTILNLVRAGMGVSLVPHAASRMRVPGIRYHEIRDDSAAWEIGPVWKRTTDRFALITKFCQALRAVSAG